MFLIPRLKSSAEPGGLRPDTGQLSLPLFDNPSCLSLGCRMCEFPSPGLHGQLGLIAALRGEGLCVRGEQKKSGVRKQHLGLLPVTVCGFVPTSLPQTLRPGENIS